MPFDGLSSDRDRRRMLLMRMRDELAKPGAWCKGVDPNRNCLVTAARSMAKPDEADAVISLLADRIKRERVWMWAYLLPVQYCVTTWNDAPSRTQADVVALLDRTIEAM